ncbi:hypothetical protein A9Q99_13145 [Gammaproteobacteria bacterium 45_16_T64]|nr:hypothetical protein A9Q99_13145 [Gammaproteobacteria bacterium 45_16_T64]
MKKIAGLLALVSSANLIAQPEDNAKNTAPETPRIVEEVLVTGGQEAIDTLGGSAQLLDQEVLEQFDYTDLNQVMSFVPGVYVRQEDGYGLRPNIGIRGATSDRSQKITLMEDGVLISPAPYTAPAAYYIPNIPRMAAVEVIKGPSAILHGPHTVGGAINFATKAIPDEAGGEIDATIGSDAYHKLRVQYGDNSEQFGYWVEALTYGADGFKELENGDDTGFVRNDLNTKLQWRTSGDVDMPQQFTLKLGYADEESDETYLGLTDENFDDDPYQRYAASQLDKFESDHSQIHLDHVIMISDTFKLNSKLYWNEFNRSWNKFDGFIDNTPANTVLNNEEDYPNLIGIIRGEQDSTPGDNRELIDITNNDRTYGSYGLQVSGLFDIAGDKFDQELTVGARYHYDYVDRYHTVKGYRMESGQLVDYNDYSGLKGDNKADTTALALFIQDKIFWDAWEITAGLRYENIEGKFEDREANTDKDSNQSVFMPGIGVFWQYTETVGLLAGVNKGFSPAGPGSEADPEESINYEAGIRYENDALRTDVIGFFSDYDNLIGRCRASDTACDVGDEFNGDAVKIYGVEATGSYYIDLDSGYSLPLSASYTYTRSEFQETFRSDFSQWGDVQEGDELPYLPRNIARVQAGIESDIWQYFVAVKYTDQMRDVPGQDDIREEAYTDALTTVDMSLSWNVSESLLTQFTIDNIFDEEAVVSRRPFGARPNKPRSYYARVKYTF